MTEQSNSCHKQRFSYSSSERKGFNERDHQSISRRESVRERGRKLTATKNISIRPSFKERTSKYTAISGELFYFKDALDDEYPILSDVGKMLSEGSNNAVFKQRIVSKHVSEDWIQYIEDNIVYLDEAVRNPRIEIVDNEEIRPVELSNHINDRSLRHLEQHTEYISAYDNRNDSVTPLKILNVVKDDTLLTYENKFLNTLIRRLYDFLYVKYSKLHGESILSGSALEFSSDFRTPTADGKLSFSLQLTEATSEGSQGKNVTFDDPLVRRVERLYRIASRYLQTDFVKAMGNNVVRPPINRTNAILKNKNLLHCLRLWEYINSYDSRGYHVEAHEVCSEPDPEYMQKLYSLLSLQYVSYKSDLEKLTEVEEKKDGAELPYEIDIESLQRSDHNIYDPLYARLIPRSQINRRPMKASVEDELLDAIVKALNASYYFERLAPVLGASQLERYFKLGMQLDQVMSFAEATRRRREREREYRRNLSERIRLREQKYEEEKHAREVQRLRDEEIRATAEEIASAEALRSINRFRVNDKELLRIAEIPVRDTLLSFARENVISAVEAYKKENEAFRRNLEFAREISAFEARLVWDAHIRRLEEERRRREDAFNAANAECVGIISKLMNEFTHQRTLAEELRAFALSSADNEAAKKYEAEQRRIEEEKRLEAERQYRLLESIRRAEEARLRRIEEEKQEEARKLEVDRRKRMEDRQNRENERKRKLAERKRGEGDGGNGGIKALFKK